LTFLHPISTLFQGSHILSTGGFALKVVNSKGLKTLSNNQC
jgi:hypothetical protein